MGIVQLREQGGRGDAESEGKNYKNAPQSSPSTNVQECETQMRCRVLTEFLRILLSCILIDITDATIRGFVTGRGSCNSLEFFLRLNVAEEDNPPAHLTRPEAVGLRHLAFEVDNIVEAVRELDSMQVSHEAIRIDGYTQQQFVFFQDPDGLPIELYERK